MAGLDIFVLIIVLTGSFYGLSHGECDLVQHLEIGKKGIIKCSFEDDFHAVVWYTPESYVEQVPLIGLVDDQRIGLGLSTGEFDIREDGCLIINNVTFLHDSNFTVICIQSEDNDPVHTTVRVVVVVKPPIVFPSVDVCPNETICYTIMENGQGVSCQVSHSRPAVGLKLVTRTSKGDIQLSTKSSIETENGSVFTSRAMTNDVFTYSSFLSLLICKAESIPGMMKQNESAILVENSGNELLDTEPIVKYVLRHSSLNLSCVEENVDLIVWKTVDRHANVLRVISYASFLEKGFTEINSNNYKPQIDGSLLIAEIKPHQEGLYTCTYENDDGGGTVLFDVIVYVPVQPVVQGCTHHQHCVLDGEREGSITCSVTGIRPKVQLEWKTFLERESSLISFTDHQLTTSSNGDVYDVTLTSKYQIKHSSMTSITIECGIQHKSKVLKSTTKLDLLFLNVQTTGEPSSSFNINILWIFAVIIPPCLLVIMVCRFYILKGRQRAQRKTRKEFHHGEDMQMIPPSMPQAGYQADPKTVFKRELKTKYKYQYSAVQPIPYIRDRLRSVDRVFVEGGFEKLVSKDTIEGMGKWEKLNSYHDVTDMSPSSTRSIIEGDPGYGKSTLTLQLAYDWCNSTAKSPLATVDILVLLRLRQLGGVHSLFRAIKQFILPKDSPLSEKDIQTILRESRLTVVILDGFDEYPEDETKSPTDIISIIRGEMSQESFVILTTRSFFLPKSYPPQSHRIRLTGFDSKARDEYIRKAVVGGNTRAAEKIKQSLQKNPVLRGLCQVPLFFVMFAHMTHESKQFITFKSVTSFFRYIIACFHSHMKNEMKDLNVKTFELHENQHAALDEVAFQSLSGKNKKSVWRKEDLVKRLGNEFYDQYRRIGILVEEELFNETDRLSEIRYDTEVRFFHKLFCEWYAAHYLRQKVVEPDADLPKVMENMSPFDLQYTYRFACGLDPQAGNKIIEYLRGIKDGEKFAVLCLLEQSGKFDQIKETVQQLCSNYITIDNNDSLLLQVSIVQLLEIGSSNQIPISFVWLKDCFKSIDLSSGSILLKSELLISSLPTLKELVIAERGRTLTKEEFSDVLEYSAMCPGLTSLRFCYISMPQSVAKKYHVFLEQRKLQVLWCTDEGDYLLSHRSGEWEVYDPRSSKNVIEGDIPAKKNLLISLMKKKYHEITTAVPVVPTHTDRLYNVNEIFVDSGLQYMVANGKDESNRQWEPLHSYQNIFTGSHAKSKRHVLQGKPGFGKSMIALKMAYDWCNDIPQSPLLKVDLFLMVQLTLENTSESIYTRLKRCVLPKDSPLSDIDIRGILRECSSAAMVLDDFNLYTNEHTDDDKSDVIQIIRGKMFKDIDVITASTFVPKECMPGTNRFRLIGFDDKAQDEYNRKVVGDDVTTCNKIKNKLRENLVLKELFSVPLFLSVFVHDHMNRLGNKLCTLNTVNTVFTWFMDCLINHSKHQEKSQNQDEHYDLENDHLDKVAFDCLCGIVLDKETVCKEVGNKCYDKYLRSGILVETEVQEDEGASNRYQREVQFYHKLFGQWFAAHYVAMHATGQESERIKGELAKLHKSDLRLICDFVSDLDEEVLGNILRWLINTDDLDELAKLLFDPFVNADNIVNNRGVSFDNGQEKSLQKSKIHLLQIASKTKISISWVCLYKCYSTVNLSGGNHLQLKSNLSIPVLTTLNKLTIWEDGREITAEEFAGILQYSSKCLALKVLWLRYCLLPQSVQAESVSVLRSRNVKVVWGAYSKFYQLNLQSCLWEYAPSWGSGVITDEDYQDEVMKFREDKEKRERRSQAT